MSKETKKHNSETDKKKSKQPNRKLTLEEVLSRPGTQEVMDVYGWTIAPKNYPAE